MRENLLPDRHPQTDFFVCDVFDAVPKSDSAAMGYPLFTLSTKPDYSEVSWEIGKHWVKLAPSKLGRATVNDRDVLIYCISQCMARINAGKRIERKMRFRAIDMLVATNRETSGDGYKRLKQALIRLQGTQIETNIPTGGKETWSVFGLISRADIIRESREGKMLEIEIELSDWVFNAIHNKGGDILTISRDYFRLRRPLERRLYEIARKFCGSTNQEWKLKLETLHERTGSQSNRREFRRMIGEIINDQDHMPDYCFHLQDDMVYIHPKEEFTASIARKKKSKVGEIRPPLRGETYVRAQKLAKGLDVYGIEQDWLRMLNEQDSNPTKPDGSFIAFVKWYMSNR